jgi:hypothetical protein
MGGGGKVAHHGGEDVIDGEQGTLGHAQDVHPACGAADVLPVEADLVEAGYVGGPVTGDEALVPHGCHGQLPRIAALAGMVGSYRNQAVIWKLPSTDLYAEVDRSVHRTAMRWPWLMYMGLFTS